MKSIILAKPGCLLLLACCIAACATQPVSSGRVNPGLQQKQGLIRTVMILPAVVHVEALSAGGVHEEQEEWSRQAERNVITAIEEQLKAKSGLQIEYLSPDSLPQETKANLAETQALFDAVNISILLHTYGPEPMRFPDKVNNFDYSLGMEVNKLAGQADALLIVRAEDHISTESRKALQVASVVLGALVGVVVVPAGGTTVASAALVDAQNGSLLWYNWIGSSGGYDLREAASTNSLIEGLLVNFPVRRPSP